jgi:hypothetical protein
MRSAVNEHQSDIDSANTSFWNELCGSTAARAWGVTDASMESLRRCDEYFLRYYPYLNRHIPWSELRGRRVLEVGLGYGSVRRIAVGSPLRPQARRCSSSEEERNREDPERSTYLPHTKGAAR